MSWSDGVCDLRHTAPNPRRERLRLTRAKPARNVAYVAMIGGLSGPTLAGLTYTSSWSLQLGREAGNSRGGRRREPGDFRRATRSSRAAG
jgi:hypothetical protein